MNSLRAKEEERKQEKLRRDIASFDRRYSHLAEYPEDFKVEVLEGLARRSHESQWFQDILVSEAVDAWDEEHEEKVSAEELGRQIKEATFNVCYPDLTHYPYDWKREAVELWRESPVVDREKVDVLVRSWDKERQR